MSVSTDLLRQAMALHREGDIESAARLYEEILSVSPENPDALHLSGLIAHQRGDHATAVERISRALQHNDRVAGVHNNLGEARRSLGQYKLALTSYQKALSLDPNYVPAWFNAGLVYGAMGDNQTAVKFLEKSVALDPHYLPGWRSLAVNYRELRRLDDLLLAWHKILELHPNEPAAWVEIGDALMNQGKLDEAREACERAIAIEPKSGGARYLQSQLKRYHEQEDPALLATLELIDREDIDPPNRRLAQFAAGKMLDDCKEYSRAFKCYQAANTGNHEGAAEATDQFLKLVEDSVSLFDVNFFAERQGWGSQSTLPVFIVGMPRSGTTLTEQMLSMHSAVSPRGELKDLHNSIREQAAATSALIDYPDVASGFDREDIAAMAASYLDSVDRQESGITRITDKMPSNLRYLGMMYLMFPNARVIWCRRDARDVCLSNYFQPFADGNVQSSDLYQLGRYHRGVDQLMAHWKTVLPDSFIYTLDYETLVSDTESETRAVLDFIGLEFEADCLNFYRSRSSANTASASQVREPMYQRSISRWERYEQFIDPLVRGLEGDEPESDQGGN